MPAIPMTWLDEFVVNLTTTNNQGDPDTIQLANGNILVSWTSNDDTGAGSNFGQDLIGQIFDPLGNRIGGEITLNTTYVVDNENNSDLAALPGGGFIMVYQDNDTGGWTDLRLQEYDEFGSPVSAGVTIVADGAVGAPFFSNPHVAVSSATSVLITYTTDTGTGPILVGKIYDTTTDTYGAQFNIITGGGITDPDVTVLSNGNYAIVGTRSQTAGDSDLYFRILDSTGANVLGATSVSGTVADGYNDNEASITALSGGGFVISFTDRDSNDTDVSYRVYNSAGVEIGSGVAGLNAASSATNDNNESAVAGLSDGSFVVVIDNDELGQMEASHISATGTLLGTFIFAGSGTEPSVTDLGDGRFSVAWTNLSTGEIAMEILDTRDFVNPTAVYTPEPNWQVGTVGDDVFTTDSDADIVSWPHRQRRDHPEQQQRCTEPVFRRRRQ